MNKVNLGDKRLFATKGSACEKKIDSKTRHVDFLTKISNKETAFKTSDVGFSLL